MAFDFKKEYREFYLPPRAPQIVEVPEMRCVAVSGAGDPNAPDGEYKRALAVLYAVAYTVKMSKLGDHRMAGYFDFVVPPLEGLWWQDGADAVDFRRKDAFRWISLIRMPKFVTEAEIAWAKEEAARKKGIDCSGAQLMTLREGLCVQMLHEGPFDGEPASIRRMEEFIAAQGCRTDFGPERRHHEIYLSDARKVPPEKWRTVIRLPIARL